MKLKLLFFILIFLISNYLTSQIIKTNSNNIISSNVYTGMTWDQIFGPQEYIKKFSTTNVNNIGTIFSYPFGDIRSFRAGAIDPNHPTHIYYISHVPMTSEFEFILFDLDTNAETIIGVLNSVNWKGLEFDPTSGILYAITVDALYSIDHTTSISTFIGTTGITATSLAIDGNGDMYSYDINNDNFYSLNKNSGESTHIAPLGFDAKIGGMAWDSNSDNIYLTSVGWDNMDSDFRIIDKNSGSSTILGSLYGGFEYNNAYYNWITFDGSNLGLGNFNNTTFEFYPNPINNIININSSLELKSIIVIDLSGKIVVEIIHPVSDKIDISNLKSGIYLMKVESHDKLTTYKIIKE